MKMHHLLTALVAGALTTLSSCGDRTAEHDHDHDHDHGDHAHHDHDHDHDHDHGDDDLSAADWTPESASLAIHINEAHSLTVGVSDEDSVKVSSTEDGKVAIEIDAATIEKFGGEKKVLFVLDWEENPTVLTREAYLESLGGIEGLLTASGEKH